MKTCPHCAETDLQDAAKVCKHCGNDVSAVTPTLAVAKRAKPAARNWPYVAVLVGLALAGFFAFYAWATSAHSVDLVKAREAVRSLERDGVLTERQCSPNRAAINGMAWFRLSDRLRRNAMLSLARVCIEEGGSTAYELIDVKTRRVIAEFDGRNIRRDR